jgi:hypothetical protein
LIKLRTDLVVSIVSTSTKSGLCGRFLFGALAACWYKLTLSLYQIGTIVLGSLVFPEHGSFYAASYFNGSRRRAFWHLDFERLLGESVADFCSENALFLSHASKA